MIGSKTTGDPLAIAVVGFVGLTPVLAVRMVKKRVFINSTSFMTKDDRLGTAAVLAHPLVFA